MKTTFQVIFFVVRAVGRIICGRPVGKTIILGFRSANLKKILIIEVTYESDRISLLRDSTISSALNFYFYIFYCNLKRKDHICRKLNSIENLGRSGLYNKKLNHFIEKLHSKIFGDVLFYHASPL